MAPACPSRVPRARATARCATRSAPRAVRRALTRRRPASASRRCRVASATSVASRASAAALAASARDIRRLRPLRRRRSVELFAALAAQSLSGRVSPAGPRPFTCGQTMLLLLFMGPWLALASCLHRACACVCMWTRGVVVARVTEDPCRAGVLAIRPSPEEHCVQNASMWFAHACASSLIEQEASSVCGLSCHV